MPLIQFNVNLVTNYLHMLIRLILFVYAYRRPTHVVGRCHLICCCDDLHLHPTRVPLVKLTSRQQTGG